jgi:hypothetical protein
VRGVADRPRDHCSGPGSRADAGRSAGEGYDRDVVLGGGYAFQVGPAGLIAGAILLGTGLLLAGELAESRPRLPSGPACCPWPVPQVMPADLCRTSMPAACCPAPGSILG